MMEKLATEVTVDKKLSGLYKTTWSLINGSPIAYGDDLNNYKKVGNYVCRLNNIAASLLNSPTQVAFILHVYDVTGTGGITGHCYRYQELTDLYANKYIRYGNSTDGIDNLVWHEWKQGGAVDAYDYNDLINKPQINSVTLQGNKTAEQLNVQDRMDRITNSDIEYMIDHYVG